MQGTWVRSLAWEDVARVGGPARVPTTTEPVLSNPGAVAHKPPGPRSCALQ